MCFSSQPPDVRTGGGDYQLNKVEQVPSFGHKMPLTGEKGWGPVKRGQGKALYRRGSVLYRRGSGARALYEGEPGLGPCKGKAIHHG